VTHDGRTWSNADRDRVELVDYDPRWPALFEAEAGRIRAALSSILAFTLEHFGSTAIPGLAAKPIIDIMLIAPGQARWTHLVDPIQSLGYVFWAENPYVHRQRIVDFKTTSRLPAVFTVRGFADAGGVMVYRANYSTLFRRAATYVDKILKGAKSEDLPVEQPTTFELVINLKAAKALGLTIPPSLLLRADQLIE
jgi:GrpB-like predicted nucleotidyltransferase (UPF0157 family)